MENTTGIFFRNLPVGISEDKLAQELVRIFPQVFAEAQSNNKLKVKVYLPRNLKTVAVVSGFQCNFAKLEEKAKENRICGRDIIIRKDQGEERNEYGEFKNKLTPMERRKLDTFTKGVSHRKVTNVFKTEFWDAINTKIFDFSNLSGYIYVNMVNIPRVVLERAGTLKIMNQNFNKNSTQLQYRTVFEALQSIRYLNKSSHMQKPPILFTDQQNKEISNSTDCKGLGVNGAILKVFDSATLIKFDTIDHDVLQNWIISLSYESCCWKCENSYDLVGIDPNLNFIGGVCKCDYKSNLEILDKERAYYWAHEKFTRLSCGVGSCRLFILHSPMKQLYANAKEYQDVVLPILQEEWKESSKGFKELHQCVGKVIKVDFVEKRSDKKAVTKDFYGLQIVVKETKFWSPCNIGSIGPVTLNLTTTKIFKKQQSLTEVSVKGTIRNLTVDEDKKGIIFIQIAVVENTVPLNQSTVTVVPKPVKTVYSASKHIIRSWFKEDTIFGELGELILNPQNQFNWKIETPTKSNKLNITDRAKIKFLQSNFNDGQKTAYSNAHGHKLSVIQGPPGTGKTFTAAAIAVIVGKLENGPVLLCTPSNVAADGIAARIHQIKIEFGIDSKVLRIFSMKRELGALRKAFIGDSIKSENSAQDYAILHEEIQKCSSWLKDDKIKTIVESVKKGDDYLLTKEDREILERHIAKLQREVVLDYNFFVCTVGSLSDKRMENWSKERPIKTLIVDEVGQLSQVNTLAAFGIKPQRTVLVGDHLQLRTTLKSFSAEIAGLDKSMMEWLDMSRNAFIPWVMLNEQYRMVPVIRDITSTVTYQGQLVDAEIIRSRPLDVPENIFTVFPGLRKSPVAVFNHSKLETQVGTSVMNSYESAQVIKIVHALLEANIQANIITILTLYEAQRSLIESELISNGKLFEDVKVFNVDGFQGRENDIIILSFVRSNSTSKIGFASVANRLNVAISRAKFFLFIVCNFDVFRSFKSQAWTRFTNELKTKAVFMECI